MAAADAKSAIVFVDGENLVFRYEEMLRSGRLPLEGVTHMPGSVVWSHGALAPFAMLDIVRVVYYTHVVGDIDRVHEAERTIAGAGYQSQSRGYSGTRQLIPRVHKKDKNSRKTNVVDVELTMDVMRIALTTTVDAVVLFTGDGDYISLVRSIASTTSKQVFVGALSSGLAPELRTCVDGFFELDNYILRPPGVSA